MPAPAFFGNPRQHHHFPLLVAPGDECKAVHLRKTLFATPLPQNQPALVGLGQVLE
jgi:hypothetical protein